MIHAARTARSTRTRRTSRPSLRHHGQHVVIESLQAKSDFWIDDIDVYFPYDGFTFITMSWIENVGWCGLGEAGRFIEDHWDNDANRILIDGRIPVNPHGGALSEGGTQGSGHIREAIHQLQGLAGDRQVPGADGRSSPRAASSSTPRAASCAPIDGAPGVASGFARSRSFSPDSKSGEPCLTRGSVRKCAATIGGVHSDRRSMPISASDIRKWAQAVYYPEATAPTLLGRGRPPPATPPVGSSPPRSSTRSRG